MGKSFKNVGEIKHYLENMVNAALDTTVKDGVIEGLENYAETDVYDVYSPVVYKRRYSLFNEENYIVDKNKNMELTITPIVDFNPYINGKNGEISKNSGNQLSGLINYGDGWGGYTYDIPPNGRAYGKPRRFIDDVKNELNDGMFKSLLAEGLENFGIRLA